LFVEGGKEEKNLDVELGALGRDDLEIGGE
jgi:hypothetical protein